MAAKRLQAHHDAWLRAHPDRTEDWLLDMFREGFDVHHVDGDHDNNAPLNLILIEAVDHMRLHGMHLNDGQKGWRRKVQEKAMRTRAVKRAEKQYVSRALEKKPAQPEPVIVPEPMPYVLGSVHSGLDEVSAQAYQTRINQCWPE